MHASKSSSTSWCHRRITVHSICRSSRWFWITTPVPLVEQPVDSICRSRRFEIGGVCGHSPADHNLVSQDSRTGRYAVYRIFDPLRGIWRVRADDGHDFNLSSIPFLRRQDFLHGVHVFGPLPSESINTDSYRRSLQLHDYVFASQGAVANVDSTILLLSPVVIAEWIVRTQSPLHLLVARGAFPRGVKQPKVIEQILLQNALPVILVDQFLELLDYVQSVAHDISIKRRLQRVPVGQQA